MEIEWYVAWFTGFVVGGVIIGLWARQRAKAALRELTVDYEAKLRERDLKIREERVRLELELERERGQLRQEQDNREQQIEMKIERSRQQVEAIEMRESGLEHRARALTAQEESLRKLEHEATKQKRLFQLKLHALARMDRREARAELIQMTERDCADELRERRAEMIAKTESEIQDQARGTLLAAMQRIASTPMNDATATVVNLPSEDLKGRIIGREGRNIRTFEQVTGTTLMIDETPDSVMISCFDPVRREIARIALEQLLRDGRIHPASIEESVHAAEEEMSRNVIEIGEGALRKLRLGNVHPEVVTLLGKLHYRLSNNQNTLDHSIEVANLCALIAAELGMDTTLAKRAGLFHDIGKSIDEETPTSHARAGADVLKKHGEDSRVVNAVAAHHEEIPADSAFAPLVMIGDALSAVRPGARTSSIEGFIQRVRSIEDIARAEQGVIDAYAIQAGREVRVIVEPERVSEEDGRQLARRLRKRIEEELTYPGSIRITVIREQRFSETAI